VRRPLLWISDIFRLPAAAAMPDRKTTLCCGFQLSPILFSSFSVLLRAQSRSNSFGFGRPIFGLVYANTHAGPYVDRNTEGWECLHRSHQPSSQMGQKVLGQAGPRCPPNNSQHWEILLRLWYYTGSYYIRSLKNEG